MLIETVAELEEVLTRPSPGLLQDLRSIEGDVALIGCGGKIGPTLARMARRALDEVGSAARVVAVSRFSDPAARRSLDEAGVETVAADLEDPAQVRGLPDAPNVVYLLGRKFGTTGDEASTWATNAYTAGRVAERYAGSRIAVFSSGNVYPLSRPFSGGCSEETPPAPVGEYAQSCLARERLFEYAARRHHSPTVTLRLNYANDLRYGVLTDVALGVRSGRPVDLAMGAVNVIWQGDVNDAALRSLALGSAPPRVLNLAGPETVSLRWLVQRFAERFGVEPLVTGEEAPEALLSNGGRAFDLFGYPRVPLLRMIDWVAHWVEIGGPLLNRPTHFQEREGTF
ncbi:MAG TPA: NAD(P)-dependent oxidoreductase [Candidatus Dormibacteraeota bacterium]|nr:NAD(P)-dependent oxidoreductase [Candidatus Dormibacteraeota bacterium]